ncbi:MAG: aminoacetone oxidase family FAD-binding enzyme, partial [Patescibacteria group bacterium]
ICAGGKSYPMTGSTGDAYKWLKQLGHQITPLKPALTPIIIRDKFIKDLEGLSLREAELSCYQGGKKLYSASGSIMFTSNGLSGPAILNLSNSIGQLDLKDLEFKIDFFPNLEWSQLDKQLQSDFSSSNRVFKNALSQLVPPKLVETLIRLSKIDSQKKLNLISREERKTLLHLLKEFKLTVLGLAGYDRAMLTSGGVSLQEVDSRKMNSKIVENLYLAGEILDLSGPTGGYNLQLCWTSGYLAGENAVS